MSRRFIAAITAIALAMPAFAQDYPSRAITIVVPYAAGGPTDTVARLVGAAMSRTLGRPVIIESVTGAGGTLGVEHVAHARPDGYTVLLMHIGISTSVSLYHNLRYDPVTDLDPIGLVSDVPMVMIARPDFAPKDVKELNGYVKANKDRVTFANAGIGSASQLCGMLYLDAIGADVTTVTYNGTGPAMTDLIGGQVDFMCDQTTNATQQIKSGKVRAFAVTTSKRLPSLPDVPTFAESGLAEVEVASWNGLWAPHGTPKIAIDKLVAALQAALRDPGVIHRFAELSAQPVAQDRATPTALREKLTSEIAKWSPIVRKIGILAD